MRLLMRRTRSRLAVVTVRVSASSAGCALASRSPACRSRCPLACAHTLYIKVYPRKSIPMFIPEFTCNNS